MGSPTFYFLRVLIIFENKLYVCSKVRIVVPKPNRPKRIAFFVVVVKSVVAKSCFRRNGTKLEQNTKPEKTCQKFHGLQTKQRETFVSNDPLLADFAAITNANPVRFSHRKSISKNSQKQSFHPKIFV